MFKVTGCGMDITTMWPNQAHTRISVVVLRVIALQFRVLACNMLLLHSLQCFSASHNWCTEQQLQCQVVVLFLNCCHTRCCIFWCVCSVTPKPCGVVLAFNSRNIVHTRREEFLLTKPILFMKAHFVVHLFLIVPLSSVLAILHKSATEQ